MKNCVSKKEVVLAKYNKPDNVNEKVYNTLMFLHKAINEKKLVVHQEINKVKLNGNVITEALVEHDLGVPSEVKLFNEIDDQNVILHNKVN